MIMLPRLAMVEIWLTTLAGEVRMFGPGLFDMVLGIARNATLAFKSTVAYLTREYAIVSSIEREMHLIRTHVKDVLHPIPPNLLLKGLPTS